MAWGDNKNLYGSDLALLIQIQIGYEDGTSEIIGNNENWKSTKSEIVSSQIYNGETIGFRNEKEVRSIAGYDDKSWSGVQPKDVGFDNLVNTYNKPTKKHETFGRYRSLQLQGRSSIFGYGKNGKFFDFK